MEKSARKKRARLGKVLTHWALRSTFEAAAACAPESPRCRANPQAAREKISRTEESVMGDSMKHEHSGILGRLCASVTVTT